MSSKPKSKKGLQPKLRFPEFRDADGWKQSTIGELGSFYYGKSAPKWSLSPDAPTLCVRYGELYTKFGTIISEVVSRTNTDPATLRFSKGGEILIPRVGEKPEDFANCCYLPFPDIAIGEMISVYETNEYPIFYTYYFRTLRKQFARVVEGQNVKNLYYVNLEPIPVGKPTIPEQKKIADCLSSLDELIEAEDAKLDALQQHKKGLMQELFPAEGETLPKRRFPEFQSSADWKIIELGSISKIVRGGSPRPIDDYLTNNPEALNWLKIGDVDKESKYVTRTQERVVHSALNKSREVNPGDLIMSNSMSFGRPYILKIKACIHDGWIAITEISKNVSLDYLYYFILSNSSQAYFMRSAAGSGVKNLNADIIKLLNIALPKLPEQKAIADSISSIDDLIAAQSQKVDTLRNHKKGLMQQLFPTDSEVQE